MQSDRSNHLPIAALALCLAIAVGACTREDAATVRPAAATPETPVSPLPPAATMHPEDVKHVTASYDCSGIRVDVIRDQVARVNLAADKIIKIERLKGSVPPTYQDVGLTFAVTDSGATLDDENGRSLACATASKPRTR